MPGDAEQAILIRRFRGVDLSQDPAFLGSDVLALSDSFAPNPIFVLAKRQGQTLLGQVAVDIGAGLSFLAPPTFLRTYDDVGNRYLVVVGRIPPIGADAIRSSVNDGTFASPANGAFTTTPSPLYGMAQLGQIGYVCHGTDPLQAVNLAPA